MASLSAPGRGLNFEHSEKVFSKCSMKTRTFAGILRLADRTTRIGTVRSKEVEDGEPYLQNVTRRPNWLLHCKIF